MWPGRSLAVALAVAFIAGCSWSDSKTYTAAEVHEALDNQGFQVVSIDQFLSADPEEEFQKVFPQVVPAGVPNIAEDREECVPGPAPGRPCPILLAAMVFKNQDRASCSEPNIIGTCLRKRNVVVVVRDDRAQAAREALDDLD